MEWTRRSCEREAAPHRIHDLRSRAAAAAELQRLAGLDRRSLRTLTTNAFLLGWQALLFLFPELHPDNALDHGDAVEVVPPNQLTLPGFEQLTARRYVRSGLEFGHYRAGLGTLDGVNPGVSGTDLPSGPRAHGR